MKMTLLVATAMLAAGMGRPLDAPPIKMGLWESTATMTMKMQGSNSPMPGMGAPRAFKVHTCYTAESWAKMLANTQRQGADCVRSNEALSPKGYSVDVSCAKSNTTGHFQWTFDDPENAHATVHMDSNPGGHAMTSDMTIATHFLSSDCGSVTPDKPQMVQ
jgi:hypothetical protein